jgi:RNA polymerase sigma factor (sigma-70 family)
VTVRDPDIVAAIVAGDPAGLTAAYESYAPALYTYCRSLLRDADDAADALHDTFIVASQKLDGLRDPERLRPWLYAVARNECLRLLSARRRTVAIEDSDEVSDESADVTVGVRQDELRDLVRAALDGLNAGDREILDLSMRHELSGAELGAALGVSANHAHALLSRARGQVEVALGALLVARAGSEDCAELAEMLRGWDGHFNTLIRKRVNRHIEGCDVCRERRRVELQPAMLLGLGPILLLPPALRDKILRLCSDGTPEAVGQRVRIGNRAEPFEAATGFPISLKRRRGTVVRRRATLSTAVALLLLLVFATGASAALHAGPFRRTADHRADVRIVAVPAPTLRVSIPPITPSVASLTPSSASPSASPTPSPSTTSTSPTPSLVITPASTAPATTQPHSSAPKPTPPPTPKRSPSPSPTPTPTPSPSVSISGNPLQLSGRRIGAFAITAEGGTVDYTITLPSPASTYGDPLLSSMSGTLANGQTVQVSVQIEDAESATTNTFDLTVDPGDIQVQVTWPLP